MGRIIALRSAFDRDADYVFCTEPAGWSNTISKKYVALLSENDDNQRDLLDCIELGVAASKQLYPADSDDSLSTGFAPFIINEMQEKIRLKIEDISKLHDMIDMVEHYQKIYDAQQ